MTHLIFEKILIACFILVIAYLPSYGADCPSRGDILKFDDKPPFREFSRSELKNIFKHCQKINIKDVYINRDNNKVIDFRDIDILREQLDKEADDKVLKLANQLNKKEGENFSESEIFKAFKYDYPEPMDKPESAAKMLIRRDYSTPTIYSPTNNIDDFKKEGAFASLGQNLEDSTGLWKIQACALFPVRLPISNISLLDDTELAAVNFVPSVEIDRQSSDSKQVDKLSLRAGFEGLLHTEILKSKDTHDIDGRAFSQYYNLLFAYVTDTGLDASIYELELDWRPIYLRWSFGKYNTVPFIPWLKNKFTFVAHGAYGRVDDVGNYDNLEEDENYFRLGPRAGLSLIASKSDLDHIFPKKKGLVNFLSSLTFSADYSYMFGLIGKPRSSRLCSFSLSYKFNKDLEWAANLTYRYGEIPITQEQVDEIILGLTWAY